MNSHEEFPQIHAVKKEIVKQICIRCGYICNLKCRYCAEKIPFYTDTHKKIFDAKNIIEDLKKLSESFAYIETLNFSGGDCMLNIGFADLVRYVSTIKNIGSIYVVTNGSYIPHKDILHALAESGRVRVEINSYPASGGGPHILTDKLKELGIPFNLRGDVYWFDPSENNFRQRTVDELKALYKNCTWTQLYCYESGKLSIRCGMSSALLYFLNKYDECSSDYVDIRNSTPAAIAPAIEKLKERGYMDVCNYCQGYPPGSRALKGAFEQL